MSRALRRKGEAQFLEEFDRRPSTMPDIGVDLSDFATEERARAVGQGVYSALHAFGKLLNLKRLHQVIVAFDYEGALANLDRGASVARPLQKTNDAIAEGVAMTPKVIREGE